MHQPESAFQVHLHHLVELALVDLQHGLLGDVGSSVVDQDIDPAEFLVGGFDQALNLVRASDVARQRIDRAGARADFRGYFLSHLVERFLLAPANHHGSGFPRERLRNRTADSAAGAGHHGDLVL